MLGKIIAIKRRDWFIYLVSQNKYIKIWYCKLAHGINVKIIQAAKLINKINLKYYTNKDYNFVKVFINLNNFNINIKKPNFDIP